MQLFNVNAQRVGRIQIVPVANGFIVYLPVVSKNELNEVIEQLGKGIQQVQEQEDEILANANRQIENQKREQEALDLNNFSDKFCYVFYEFTDVLAFLQKTYDK